MSETVRENRKQMVGREKERERESDRQIYRNRNREKRVVQRKDGK